MNRPSNLLFGNHTTLLQQVLACTDSGFSPGKAQLPGGTRLKYPALGVLWAEPENPVDHQLIISAGVHGDETAPIELMDRLVSELLEEAWPLRMRTLFIMGNPPAMGAAKRFVDQNLNRLFDCGEEPAQDQATGVEGQRARELQRQVTAFVDPDRPLLHYDLHTALRESCKTRFAVYPYLPGRQLPKEQAQFLLNSDVRTVLLQNQPATTFSAWTSSEFGAESFTIELGKVRPFGQNDATQFQAMEASLRQLLQGKFPPQAAGPATTLERYEVVHEIIRTSEDFVLHLSDAIPNFTTFPPGTLIWEDGSQSYRVGAEPEAIVFPNPKVKVGERAGLLLRRLP